MASREGMKGNRGGGSGVRLPYCPALTEILAGAGRLQVSGTVWFRAMALARGAKKIDCATRRSIMMTVKKHSRRRWKHRAGNGLPQKRRVKGVDCRTHVPMGKDKILTILKL